MDFRLKTMRSIVLVVHNVRSAHNVGSLFRTADGFGVARLYLTGYTPFPASLKDSRLPHISAKVDRRIHKTALGAEKTVPWTHAPDIFGVIAGLKADGFSVIALEQTAKAKSLQAF